MAYWRVWLHGHNGLLKGLIAGSQWLIVESVWLQGHNGLLSRVFGYRVTMAYCRGCLVTGSQWLIVEGVWLQGHNGLLSRVFGYRVTMAYCRECLLQGHNGLLSRVFGYRVTMAYCRECLVTGSQWLIVEGVWLQGHNGLLESPTGTGKTCVCCVLVLPGWKTRRPRSRVTLAGGRHGPSSPATRQRTAVQSARWSSWGVERRTRSVQSSLISVQGLSQEWWIFRNCSY